MLWGIWQGLKSLRESHPTVATPLTAALSSRGYRIRSPRSPVRQGGLRCPEQTMRERVVEDVGGKVGRTKKKKNLQQQMVGG